jgi:hypothetical protein
MLFGLYFMSEFDKIRQGGKLLRENTIALQTKRGSDIHTEVGTLSTPQTVNQFERFKKKHGNVIELRKEATSEYNCAGMVWASRRCILIDSKSWEQILIEDGFTEIQEQSAELDDLVLYYWEDGDKLVHIGKVIRFADSPATIATNSTDGAPSRTSIKVLSKIGCENGEVIHDLISPCLGEEPTYVKFYTDRHVKQPSQR